MCQFFISIVVVVSQVILHLTSTHQKNPLPQGRNPGNPGDCFWLIPRAVARSDPSEMRTVVGGSGSSRLSLCPFLLSLLPLSPQNNVLCQFLLLFRNPHYVSVFLEKIHRFVVFPFLVLINRPFLSLHFLLCLPSSALACSLRHIPSSRGRISQRCLPVSPLSSPLSLFLPFSHTRSSLPHVIVRDCNID